MYLLDYYDIMFFVTSLKNPSTHFNIQHYVVLTQDHPQPMNYVCYIFFPNNTSRHFYFTHLPRNWNSLPVLNLNLSIANIKSQIKQPCGTTSGVISILRILVLFTSVVHAETVTIILQDKTFKNFNRNMICCYSSYIQIVNLILF